MPPVGSSFSIFIPEIENHKQLLQQTFYWQQILFTSCQKIKQDLRKLCYSPILVVGAIQINVKPTRIISVVCIDIVLCQKPNNTVFIVKIIISRKCYINISYTFSCFYLFPLIYI